MVEPKTINNIGELIDIVFNEKDKNGRMSRSQEQNNFIFRGLPNANYPLSTILKRTNTEYYIYSYIEAINDFQLYGQMFYSKMKEYNFWEVMVLSQHYGIPTRLLDWTYSPLVALHFATIETEFGKDVKNDVAVWIINVNEINSLLPIKYKEMLDKNKWYIFTSDNFIELGIDTIDKYEEDMKSNSFLIFEPPSLDSRIFNQDSVFSILPKGLDPLDKFLCEHSKINAIKAIIPKDKVAFIRDQLDLMLFNERTLFQGLDGLASWIKRRYFYAKNND